MTKEREERRRRRGVGEPYYLPPRPEDEDSELPQHEEDPGYGWSDVVAFIIAAYQVLFPILGIMFGVFLLIWGVLWLLAR